VSLAVALAGLVVLARAKGSSVTAPPAEPAPAPAVG
jgi:hypothetical protein